MEYIEKYILSELKENISNEIFSFNSSKMDWWLYLILALTVVFTIVLWNTYNSQTYQRLRKAKNIWDDSSPKFKARVKAGVKNDFNYARKGTKHVWDQITDVFDGNDGYDSDEGGYDGDYGGYM